MTLRTFGADFKTNIILNKTFYSDTVESSKTPFPFFTNPINLFGFVPLTLDCEANLLTASVPHDNHAILFVQLPNIINKILYYEFA